MAQKGISTQEEATQFSNELSKLSSNLAFHVNNSLSKAHGVSLMYGYIDSLGQDRRTYQDSNGQLVSHGNVSLPNFVRFVIDDVGYYAACLIPPAGGTDPGGQTYSTGITLKSSRVSGESSLITDYVLLDTLAAQGMEDYILKHSRLTHQIAHTPLTVVPQPTYRSNGAVIGTWRIRIPVSGFVYEIPCDTRIGGPAQPPRLAGLTPSSITYHTGPGSHGDYGLHFIPVVSGGTLPYTFSYEYWQNGSWIPFTGDSQYIFPSGIPPVLVDYDTTTGRFHIENGGGGGGTMQLRVTVSNEAGSTHTIYGTGKDCVFTFYYSHDSPGCWFCTEANKYQPVTPEQWRLIGTVEQEIWRRERRGLTGYVRFGDILMSKMVGQGVGADFFTGFTTKLIQLMEQEGCGPAAAYYIETVRYSVERYWPDTPVCGLKRLLDNRFYPKQ